MKNNFYLWFNEWKWYILSWVGVGFMYGVTDGWLSGVKVIVFFFMLVVSWHVFFKVISALILKEKLNKIVFYELSVLIIWYVFLIYINLMVIVLMTLVSSLILSLAVVYIIKNNG